jgi:hypothetical protein
MICAAVRRAEKGMIDADIGQGLLKQRIPRENKGRSGGFRSILFYKKGGMAVFLHLYAKSMRAHVSASEQQVLEKACQGTQETHARADQRSDRNRPLGRSLR